MKLMILLSFISSTLFLSNTPKSFENVSVVIEVTDEAGQPLVGANFSILKNEEIIFSGITDVEGKASFLIEEGTYNISISYTGYATFTKSDHTFTKVNNKLEISLFRGKELNEIAITGMDADKMRKSPAYERPHKSRDMAISEYEPVSAPTTMTLKGYSSAGKDGVSLSQAKLPGSGQITAGEWNDLSNWKEWTKLIEKKEYTSMQSHWGVNTLERYSVAVINNNNTPLPGAKVILVDKYGEEIWTSYSDVAGKAELWNNAFEEKYQADRIIVKHEGSTRTIRQLRTINQGSMIATINIECADELDLDIAFVVDATSSMSDEIRYLQSELLDVINRVKSERKNIRWSSVFYRDSDDEYITRIQQFTNNHNEVLEFIRSQEASGGGDFPEAVSEALEVSVNNLDWNETSEVKLCFLLLDAPPHENEVSMSKYKKHLAKASATGIKIIPVTASGINRETEFLMKFTAMMTNGTYVFITDDSGIGNAHLDPVVKDYEVEKLNDLIVRLITAYSRKPECRQEIAQSSSRKLKYYPNPATSILNIENVKEGDKVYVISTSGKIVSKHEVQSGGVNKINIEELISGSYILRWIKENDNPEDHAFLVIR